MYYPFYLKDSLKNVYANILSLFCSFSYRRKVIVKGVNNIIGIGYRITVIKREQSWYTGCYSFQRNKGFNSFPCVLNIIPIYFKTAVHSMKRTEKIIFSSAFVCLRFTEISYFLNFPSNENVRKQHLSANAYFCVNMKFSYTIAGRKDEIFYVLL